MSADGKLCEVVALMKDDRLVMVLAQHGDTAIDITAQLAARLHHERSAPPPSRKARGEI